MAPRTRSGKGLDIEQVAAHRKALRAGPVNTQGFPGLPTELHFEIISHLPVVPFPCNALGKSFPLDGSYLLRGQLIRALSQMCKSLRLVFLPLTYERIEVCAFDRASSQRTSSRRRYPNTSHDRKARVKAMSFELVRQLEVVTVRDPSLAAYVRTVNVMLDTWSYPSVAEELLRCLPLFPALQTIQFVGGSLSGEVVRHCKHRFPSVTRVYYSPNTNSAIKLFPGIKLLVPPYLEMLLLDIDNISEGCPSIEDVHIPLRPTHSNGSIKPGSGKTPQERIHKVFPKLQVIRFGIGYTSLPLCYVEQASCLADLRDIIFHFEIQPGKTRRKYINSEEFASCMTTAVRILKDKPDISGRDKRVIVLSTTGCTLFRILVTRSGYTRDVDTLQFLKVLKDIIPGND